MAERPNKKPGVKSAYLVSCITGKGQGIQSMDEQAVVIYALNAETAIQMYLENDMYEEEYADSYWLAVPVESQIKYRASLRPGWDVSAL